MTTRQALAIVSDLFPNARLRRRNDRCEIIQQHVIHCDAIEVLGRGDSWEAAIDSALDHELDILAEAFAD